MVHPSLLKQMQKNLRKAVDQAAPDPEWVFTALMWLGGTLVILGIFILVLF